MSILQISQVLFPFATYPYLIRVLGKETFGLLTYSTAIIAYLIMFINFGFNISEIKEISIHRDDREKVSEIVSSVIAIRLLLLIVSILILLICLSTVSILKTHKLLYFSYLGVMINAAIDPSFYFQGIERMKFTTIISVLSSLLFLILIFLFVKNEGHVNLVPLFTSFGAFTGSAFGLYTAFKNDNLKFYFPHTKQIKAHIVESLPFFSSRLSVLLMEKTNTVLLGSFIGYTQVSYYDIAAKLVAALKVPFGIINQVIFPNVSKTKNIVLVKKALVILIIFYTFGYFSLYLLAPFLVVILGGHNVLPSTKVVYILGITLIIDLISTFMGAPMLLATGHKREYNMSIIIGSIIYIVYVFLLYLFKSIGLYQLTIATVCSGFFILLFRSYYCRIYKLI
ncbi:transporter [Segetibacter aerophilus]|uniref:Transporter n=2 Tax=Segetibacter aerophilus TaxID=670293 RepID=A0A512BGY8_9BACT|nr:transporter [Segetibacter aerophilus]